MQQQVDPAPMQGDGRRLSIRARLVLLVLGFAIPVAGLFAWYLVMESRERATDAAARVRLIADGIARNLASTLQDHGGMLARLARLPAVRAMDASSCGPFVGEFGAAVSEYAEIGLRDTEGNSLCAFVADPPPAHQTRGFAWFQQGLRAQGLAIGDAFQGARLGRWFSVLTHPVHDARGRLAGLLVFRLDLHKLNQRVMQAIPAQAVAGVLDRGNRVLLRSQAPEQWIGQVLPDALASELRAQDEGFVRAPDLLGVPRLIGIVLVPGTDWRVMVGLPEALVFADRNALIAQGIGVGLLGLALLLAVVWRLGASIGRPISALALTSQQVGRGDTAARAPVDGPAEVADVARHFNAMLDTRLRMEKELHESELRYRSIVHTAMDAIVTVDDAQRIVQFNPAAETMFGLPAHDAIGRGLEELIPHRFRSRHTVHVHAFGAGSVTSRRMGELGVLQALRRDGSEFPIEASISRVSTQDGMLYSAIVRDITARIDSETRARRQDDFYSALSHTNKALVRRHEPAAIYQEICDICVKFGHARIAYVGLVEGATVRPVCFAGPAEAFLSGLELVLDPELPEGRGPLATAIRNGRSHVCNDFLNDPATLPWRERARYLQTRGIAAFPFRRGAVVSGALSLHVAEKDFFSPQLIALIEEMASDLGFALDNADRERSRIEAESALHETQERYRLLIEMSPDAVFVLRAGHIVFVNPAALRMLEARVPADLLGRRMLDFVHPDARALAERRLGDPRPDVRGDGGAEMVLLRLDGSALDVEVASGGLRYDGGPAVQAIVRDISERKRAEARIKYLATHDELTELPNRILIQDRITQAISHARRTGLRVALMHLDLDRFKVVNDGYGHEFGDAVLKAAGQRLVATVRDGDTVARLSADEFLVLLVDLGKPSDAYVVTQEVLQSFDRPFTIDGRDVVLGCSIGVSIFPQHGEQAHTLILNADIAMYRCKSQGGGGYQFFASEMSDESQQRVELETHLRAAPALDQLELVYQPKVRLADGAMVGCEALLRWNHPTLGAVSPTRFIPIAEESGLIVPIGDWALRAACLRNRAWLDAGLPPLVVSVNLSARQFLRKDVVGWVTRTLQETGLPATLLELELTESLIAQDTEAVIDSVQALKQLGVRFSIDDFGTGYSNLSYLKRFMVDTLKIDQSFIRNMLHEPDGAVIPLAIIALAHQLRLRVIAEGVETPEQCELLRRNGCDEIQGFLFSPPLGAADFEQLLREARRLVM